MYVYIYCFSVLKGEGGSELTDPWDLSAYFTRYGGGVAVSPGSLWFKAQNSTATVMSRRVACHLVS